MDILNKKIRLYLRYSCFISVNLPITHCLLRDLTVFLHDTEFSGPSCLACRDPAVGCLSGWWNWCIFLCILITCLTCVYHAKFLCWYTTDVYRFVVSPRYCPRSLRSLSADAFYGCYANVNKTFVYNLKRTFTKVMNSTKLFKITHHHTPGTRS